MTDPMDETQPHPTVSAETPPEAMGIPGPDQTPARATGVDATPGVILPPPGPPSAGQTPLPAPPPLVPGPSAWPGPSDPLSGPIQPPPSAAPGGPPTPPLAAPGQTGSPPLRADPNRPAASDWREPPWFPPRDRPRHRGPSLASIVVGLVLVAIGLYYLLDVTLGISLPRVRWGSLWPLILIGIGGLIVLRAAGRR